MVNQVPLLEGDPCGGKRFGQIAPLEQTVAEDNNVETVCILAQLLHSELDDVRHDACRIIVVLAKGYIKSGNRRYRALSSSVAEDVSARCSAHAARLAVGEDVAYVSIRDKQMAAKENKSNDFTSC